MSEIFISLLIPSQALQDACARCASIRSRTVSTRLPDSPSAKASTPNGGAVGLGHPIGATGALLTVKALYELQRTGGRYALVTMCIGGGQGMAMIIERLS